MGHDGGCRNGAAEDGGKVATMKGKAISYRGGGFCMVVVDVQQW